jgi:hypothetical protein
MTIVEIIQAAGFLPPHLNLVLTRLKEAKHQDLSVPCWRSYIVRQKGYSSYQIIGDYTGEDLEATLGKTWAAFVLNQDEHLNPPDMRPDWGSVQRARPTVKPKAHLANLTLEDLGL